MEDKMDYGIIRYKNGRMWIPTETAEMAKSIGLLQYFRQSRPGELKRVGNDYCTKSHDSLKMSENGKWNWYSQGIGGKNAIDYLVKIEGMNFQEAVLEVLSATPVNYSDVVQKQQEQGTEKYFVMPEKDDDFSVARKYLIERGIDPEVIDYFYDKGDIYQEKRYKSVCFIGRDEKGVPRLANLRGTRGSFKNTSTGSDRKYAFSLFSSADKGLHITEAPIDMLSYCTFVKLNGYDFRNFNYMSLSGIYAANHKLEESKVPVCLTEFFRIHPDVDMIYVHFDNDAAGITAGKALKLILPEKKVVFEYPPERYKDVNEFLCKISGMSVSAGKGYSAGTDD